MLRKFLKYMSIHDKPINTPPEQQHADPVIQQTEKAKTNSFNYYPIHQGFCNNYEGMNIVPETAICSGVAIQTLLEDDIKNDGGLFYTEEFCLIAENYQRQSELKYKPYDYIKKTFEKKGLDVITISFFDYNEFLTQQMLNSVQRQAEKDGKKHSVYNAKQIFKGGHVRGHALFFSAEQTPDNQLLCSGMDPSKALTRGYGEEGCDKVKKFMASRAPKTDITYNKLMVTEKHEDTTLDKMLSTFSKRL
jgi:hypothetical protein